MARLFTRIFNRTEKEPEPAPEATYRTEPRLPLPEVLAPPAGPLTPVETAGTEPGPASEAGSAAAVSPAAPLLSTIRWGPAKGPAVENIVFLCHGMGSTANGIIQIAPQLATLLPATLFVAPNGPEYAEASDGRLWFDASDHSPAALEAGVRGAAEALDALIDAELDEAGLGREACALVGYSQGAMTALFTGLRRRPPPRAILCYAGALIAPYSLEAEMTGPLPVMLVHGLEDRVVPAFYSRDAEKALRALHFPVQTLYAPQLGHDIDGAVVQAGKQFLRRSLTPEGAGSGKGRSLADGG